MSIRLDFGKGTVKQDLAMLPEKMLDGAFEAINQAADLIVGLAQVNVRVDTGSLRDSIRKERVGPTYHNHRLVRVRAGGYVVNPRTGKLVDYAGVVERKFPYMRPAWEEVKGQVEQIIRRVCLEHVKELESAI